MSILMDPTAFYMRTGEIRFRSIRAVGAPVALRTRTREKLWDGHFPFVSIQLDNIPTTWFCWEIPERTEEDVTLYRYQPVIQIVRAGKNHIAYAHCSKYLNACAAMGEDMSVYFGYHFEDEDHILNQPRFHTPWKCYWPYEGIKKRCLTIHDLSWHSQY